jgi:CdiI immunity protein
MSDDTVSESIRQFFGGYFHDDWNLEADDWQGAVDDYIGGESAAQLLSLAQEVDDLRSSHSEDSLAILMYRRALCSYNPRPLTYYEWMGKIADRLRQHAAAIDNDGLAKQMSDDSISWELGQFFGGYFLQNFDLEAEDWQGLVDLYVDDKPDAEQLRTLAEEIDGLRESRPEPELRRFLLDTAGSYYCPDPLPYRDWLGEVAHRLRQHAAGIKRNAAAQR